LIEPKRITAALAGAAKARCARGAHAAQKAHAAQVARETRGAHAVQKANAAQVTRETRGAHAAQKAHAAQTALIALAALASLAALLLLSSCGASVAAQPAPELLQPVVAPVDLVQVRRGDIRPQKVAEGIVVPYSKGLSFLAADAPISAIHVTHGQRVSEGELLAELDMSVWRSRLDGAQSELDHIVRVAEYENTIANIRLEQKQMDVDAAQNGEDAYLTELGLREYKKRDDIRRETHALDVARLQARINALSAQEENYKMYAPFDGVILSIESLMIGNYPSGRAPFLYLADLNRLTVRSLTEQTSFFTSARSIAAIIGDTEWPIEIIPYTLEEQLAFYYEGITPPARFGFINEGGSFEAGSAPPTDKRVLIMTREPSSEDVIIIPINAAHTETASDDEGVTSRQEFAYVDVNGVRERRDIRCGRRSDIWLEVIDGLAEGELVYVSE